MSLPPLELAQHRFDQKKYGDSLREARSYLSSATTGDDENRVKACIIAGRSLLSIKTVKTYSYPTYSMIGRGGNYISAQSGTAVGVEEIVDHKGAQAYFEDAILIDSNCHTAHFYLGKCFEIDTLFQNALNSYVKAHLLNTSQPQYLKACKRLFSMHSFLMLESELDLSIIQESSAYAYAKASDPFLRMIGSAKLSQLLLDRSTEARVKANIRKIFNQQIGTQICCCFIPCTGDSDRRIRTHALQKLNDDEYALV